MSERPCTCHPDDNPPRPCPQKFALSECREAHRVSAVAKPELDCWPSLATAERDFTFEQLWRFGNDQLVQSAKEYAQSVSPLTNNAAPQETGESRSTLERAQNGQDAGNDAAAKGKRGDSSVSKPVTAGAAPIASSPLRDNTDAAPQRSNPVGHSPANGEMTSSSAGAAPYRVPTFADSSGGRLADAIHAESSVSTVAKPCALCNRTTPHGITHGEDCAWASCPLKSKDEAYWACRKHFGRIVSAGELETFAAGYNAARPVSATAVNEDTKRLDWLETLLWSGKIGNGLAIFPTTGAQDGVKHVCLQDLGEEDGSNLGEELTDTQMSLRVAIDASMSVTDSRQA